MGRQHDRGHRLVRPGVPTRVHGPMGGGRQLRVKLGVCKPRELEVCVPEVHGQLDTGCPLTHLIRQPGHHGHLAAAGRAWTERQPEEM